jgi:hypothetical protein
MVPTHIRPLSGLALAGLLFAAGCGGDGGGDSSATPTSVTTQAVAASSTTTTTKVDPAKIKAEATKNFTTFFDHFTGDPALLEDGESLKSGMDGLRAVPLASHVTMTVHEVTPLDAAGCQSAGVTPPCAKVIYDLNVDGDPKTNKSEGYVVQQNGVWKVAKTTFCSLTAMGGNPPAACS